MNQIFDVKLLPHFGTFDEFPTSGQSYKDSTHDRNLQL